MPRKFFDCVGFARKVESLGKAVERSEGRMIAEEMIGIDVDLLNDAAQSQLHDTPVMSGRAPAARFPSVHPFAAVGVFVGMKIPRPGLRRFSFSAKNSSLARSAMPPRRAEARSTRPGGVESAALKGSRSLWGGGSPAEAESGQEKRPPYNSTAAIGAVGPWTNE